jgi:hypothetical protein
VANLEAATGPVTIELGPATISVDYEVVRLPGRPATGTTSRLKSPAG